MSRTTTNIWLLIVAVSFFLFLASKMPPETSPALPTIWEREIAYDRYRWDFGSLCLPAVGEDRSVYVGSPDGTLYAFNGGGSQSWKYDINGPHKRGSSDSGVNGIAIDSSGTIYATSNGLLAFTNKGELKWRIWGEKNTGASAPALGANDRIHILLGNSLYAFDQEGTVEWVHELDAPCQFAPVVAKDGTIYVAARRYESKKFTSFLYALSPDGDLRWTFETEYLSPAPALDEEGTIYFLGTRHLYAVDKEGQLKWLYDTQGLSGSSTPAVSSDHVVYFGLGAFLFAVGPDGKLKWRFETDAGVRSSPAIDEKGNIWFGSSDKQLYCVDRQGTLIGSWPLGMRDVSPLIDKHGRIYVHDARSIKVLRGTNGPANCPWPMQRHDVQGTARF